MQRQGLLKQIEYYMGDSNLTRDDFFREQIQSSKDGYIELKVFLNCNAVKKLGITDLEVIKEHLEKSTTLEMNPKKTGVRRKGNMALP